MKSMKKTICMITIFSLLLGHFAGYSADVTAKKKAIRLNKKAVSVYVGKSVKLNLLNTKKNVTWSSSKKKVAIVSKRGVVKGKRQGKAIVTAKVNRKAYTCKVTVKKKSKKPAVTTQPTKTPIVTPRPTQTPVPTVVPTPDVRMVTMANIESWNKNNENFDVVRHKDGKVSFISGQVFPQKVTNKDEAYQAVAALKGVEQSEDIDLCFLQKNTDKNGDIYYRFNQLVEGFIITSRIAVLATDAEGNTISYSSNLLADTKKVEVPKMIKPEEAIEAVREADSDFVPEPFTEPCVEIEEIDDIPVLCWIVIGKNPMFLEKETEYPYLKYAVDASERKVLCYYAIPHVGEQTTEESIYNSNMFRSAKTEDMVFTNQKGEKISLPVAKFDETHYYIIDTKRKIIALDFMDGNIGIPHDNLFLFEKAEEVSPNFVTLMENFMKIYDTYAARGFLSTDGMGKKSISIHLGYRKNGVEISNAFYWSSLKNESRFVFSDMKEMSNLDVVAHEYAHAIQQNLAKGMEYSWLSGAIMESFADIVGNLLQMSVSDNKDCDKEQWALGENDSSKEGALRIMGDPHAFDQPEYVGDIGWVSCEYISYLWNDNSGVHENCSVLSYICYSLFKDKKQNFTYEEYFDIWFDTVYLITNGTTYDDYQAYVKYSMRRSKNPNSQKAVDEVFQEANISNVNETQWDYDLKDGCAYIDVDAAACKENEFLAANIYWTDEKGVEHMLSASSKGDDLIAMVPKNVECQILYGIIVKDDPNLNCMMSNEKISVKNNNVTLHFDREKIRPGYTLNSAWAYLPSDYELEEDTYADVFFINPTAVVGSESELNMEMYDKEARESFLAAINMEKEIYNQSYKTEKGDIKTYTHFFAPYYRQQTLEGVSQSGEKKETCKQLALTDINRAFRYFMTTMHKKGTPIILAGFSQGSEMIIELLKTYADDEDFQADYLASYAIGWHFSDEFLAENPSIKMAQGEDDLGVVVSFCSEAEDYNGSSIIVPENTHTNGINPLNWKTDSTPADKSENDGACFMNGDGTINKEVNNLCGAYLDKTRGTLKVTDINTEDYPPVIRFFQPGNFHIYDYQFFFRNLQKNVLTRIGRAHGIKLLS